MTDKVDWLCVGVIAGAHGVKGEVRLKSFTEEPAAIGAFDALFAGAGREPIRLLGLRPAKGGFVGRIEGVTDREAAEALKGTELFVRRADLPSTEDEDEFYLADLEGLTALDGNGAVLGSIAAIHDFGAGPLLEIKLAADRAPRKYVGVSPLVPFTKALVPEVDIGAGRVIVLLDKWLEEGDGR